MVKIILKKSKLCVYVYESFMLYIQKKKREKRLIKHLGRKHPFKKFWVIIADNIHAGIFSNMLDYVLPVVEDAVNKGYIPVIDMERTFLSLLQDEDRRGLDNPWEYYYQQPDNRYSLKEVYQSRNVRVGRDAEWIDWKQTLIEDPDVIMRWNKVIVDNIRLTDELQKRVDFEADRLFQHGKKVLGVGIRAEYRWGALNKESLYNNHPKIATCEKYIEIVESRMREWGGYDSLFLAIDDREYCEKFKRHFGEKCLLIDRRLMHFFKDDKPTDEKERLVEKEGYSVRAHVEEYILETYLLARCTSLYASRGGGITFACFLNGGKYERIEIYNEGFYEGLGK